LIEGYCNYFELSEDQTGAKFLATNMLEENGACQLLIMPSVSWRRKICIGIKIKNIQR